MKVNFQICPDDAVGVSEKRKKCPNYKRTPEETILP